MIALPFGRLRELFAPPPPPAPETGDDVPRFASVRRPQVPAIVVFSTLRGATECREVLLDGSASLGALIPRARLALNLQHDIVPGRIMGVSFGTSDHARADFEASCDDDSRARQEA